MSSHVRTLSSQNGAESLLRTLIACGVEVCFANPGTSEMQFVAALDRVEGMRPVLGLAETVVTGAADGYGRMTGRPACTLLHLGPGLANGLANLHNARRAGTPIVNIVGNHASSHLQYDTPLTSDVVGVARPVSAWIHSSARAADVGADAARAVRAATEAPGQIATLVLPADAAWDPADAIAPALPAILTPQANADAVRSIADRLRNGAKAGILMRGPALQDRGLEAAGRIAAKAGARLICDTFAPRIQRGAGRVIVERMPYFGEEALAFLGGLDLLILVGAAPPVSFFAYPGRPSWLTPEGCALATLSHPHEDGPGALEALCAALEAEGESVARAERRRVQVEHTSPLTAESIMTVVAKHLPDQAIIADESVSSGFPYYHLTATAAPHDYLNLTGGAIGSMLSVAIGAAVACPDRKVIVLQGDGSAMYNVQALWTHAREQLDIVTIIYANRAYSILAKELIRVGASEQGRRAHALMDIGRPDLDWVRLANGQGVEAIRVDTTADFESAFQSAMAGRGPKLIEAVI
jgi:acetolactate synthase I/II/III large subunit